MTARLRLVDAPGEAGRTTATLLASLAAGSAPSTSSPAPTRSARWRPGSPRSGAASSTTAEGARAAAGARAGPRRRERRRRSGPRSRIDDVGVVASAQRRCSTSSGTTSRSCSPTTCDETLELMPIPRRDGRRAGRGRPAHAEFVDFVLGLWAFSRELVRRGRGARRADAPAARRASRRRGAASGAGGRSCCGDAARHAAPAVARSTCGAAAYKDWLHLNLFDHGIRARSGSSTRRCTGRRRTPRSRAVGAALLHVPGHGLDRQHRGARRSPTRTCGSDQHRARAGRGRGSTARRVLASARLPRDGLVARPSTATASLDRARRRAAAAARLGLDLVVRRARSWPCAGARRVAGRTISTSTGATPTTTTTGAAGAGATTSAGSGAASCLRAAPRSSSAARTTARIATDGRPCCSSHSGGQRRAVFAGRAAESTSTACSTAEPRRLPGALAALHGDRAVPRLPACCTFAPTTARTASSSRFRARACAQLIAADPAERGYGFIHELVGEFSAASGDVRGDGASRRGTGGLRVCRLSRPAARWRSTSAS